ncbi:MAG: hypothetical protein KKG35_15615, partial [Proteobacteria bacterium]|nr:hypothetical protein [Pseudomonadota bacterium]
KYPELAAMERQEDERSAAISTADQAQEDGQQNQQDQAVWGTWLEYLKAADKDDYYTLIVIDNAYRGDEKDYSRDHGLLARETAGWVSHSRIWDFSYPQKQESIAASPSGNKTQHGSKSEVEKTTNSAGNKSQQESKSEMEKTKEQLGGAVKEGFKALKGLW